MSDGAVADRRFFYLHVMKTGGGTFSRYLRANHPPGSVYPDSRLDEDLGLATRRIDYVLGLTPERHRAITVYTGHFPSIVPDLLDESLVRLTILRDPVERTISYLRHCKHHHDQHRDLPLEAIYEDPFFFPGFILNHQTKQFSMTTEDPLTTYFQSIPMDGARLALAKQNLERCAVIGLTEAFPALIDEVQARFGWGPLAVSDIHRARDDTPVPAALRRRIAHDNAIDAELYDHARALVARRHRTAGVT